MFKMNRGTRLAVIGTVAVVCTASLRWPRLGTTDAGEPPQHSADRAKIQQEEIDTLHDAAKVADTLFTNGLGTADEVDRLNRLLVQERMRLATSADQKLDILRETLATAKSQEDAVSQRFHAGVVNQLAPLEAKAFRLSIEEQLLDAGDK